jgi:hypothetical protein
MKEQGGMTQQMKRAGLNATWTTWIVAGAAGLLLWIGAARVVVSIPTLERDGSLAHLDRVAAALR